VAQIARLHNYANGVIANAEHVQQEFDQLISQTNVHDGKLEKTKLDIEDENPGYILDKLVAGSNISLVEQVVEGIRQLVVSATGELSLNHGDTANRNLPDQHTIEAITGLTDALATATAIPDGSINAAKLAAVAMIATAHLIDLCVTTAKISNLAVTNDKVANGTLTEAKFVTTVQNKLATDRTRKITISTGNPSGGSDGDIWIKYS
jgi:hypothetical protein